CRWWKKKPLSTFLFPQKNILVENDVKMDKDGLTDLYIQHAIPLPQRDLPKSRWGKMMEKKRQQNEFKSENKSVTTVEGLRKRPLIVFDGSSTSTSIKVKKTENGTADRLKPPPQNSISKTNSSMLASLKVYPLSPVAGTTVVKLKRAVPKEESDLPVCIFSILFCSFLFNSNLQEPNVDLCKNFQDYFILE
uniref:Ashwin n=1 Tax=Amazona collaria TaxID=241587 RepID=A0A8B9FP08_9PSIT